MFVDLRDRYGITQVIFENAGDTKEIYEKAKAVGREFVLQVTGKVKSRGKDVNKERATGAIEIVATDFKILNISKTPPFLIQDDTDAKEETRLKHRYLDLRRNKMKECLLLRNRVTIMVRKSLNEKEFCEVETPVLIKSTPEGARDFVVPSRTFPGNFFALPQSPQTFKQLLMVAGLDRYFQIVKCFRDEDLRNDRQPEFTQIDCEMSFVKQNDVLSTFEDMMYNIFAEVVGHKFPMPFPRLTWDEAMKTYGIDKPDLRYDMKLVELTDLAKGKSESFKIFDASEIVIGIRIPGDEIDYESKKWESALKKAKDGKPENVSDKDREASRVRSWSKKILKQVDKVCKGQDVGAKAMFWVKVCFFCFFVCFSSSSPRSYHPRKLQHRYPWTRIKILTPASRKTFLKKYFNPGSRNVMRNLVITYSCLQVTPYTHESVWVN